MHTDRLNEDALSNRHRSMVLFPLFYWILYAQKDVYVFAEKYEACSGWLAKPNDLSSNEIS